MLVEWTVKEVPEGKLYTKDVIYGYAIHEKVDGKFYVKNTDEAWDDIGPLYTFKEAEDTILKMCIAIVEFEESLWKVSAALAIKKAQTEDLPL